MLHCVRIVRVNSGEKLSSPAAERTRNCQVDCTTVRPLDTIARLISINFFVPAGFNLSRTTLQNNARKLYERDIIELALLYYARFSEDKLYYVSNF